MDIKQLSEQLYPAWTGVNIGIMIIGFLLWWPLGLFMCAYMQWGSVWGLDLRRWETVPATAARAVDKGRQFIAGGIGSLSNGHQGSSSHAGSQVGSRGSSPDFSSTGTPSNQSEFESWRKTEIHRLQQERDSLNREREALHKERAQFEAGKKRNPVS